MANAIIKGRNPLVGCGMTMSRNDEDWVTLKSLHWDNCKVEFRPGILVNTVYDLLRLGAIKEDIICQYGILLQRHHALAVDIEADVWQPSKLVNDLRKRVFEKMGL